ncbi:hypothetical protein PGT21_000236 [Puccinia graminis f. sp. tritici]|uniref:Uncharacterized protein n=1 Tax=Puccinia graminis f. sp. tritici TaxID=56615 RepID=A0A5B0PAU2_PUCGR|nr:hypothetical protein PGT21_000236 [Puccinia graminis f. sp. tritici]
MVKKLTIRISQPSTNQRSIVKKSTIQIALPRPYQWLMVEIATKNPANGQKINHLDFPSTTHQWLTVKIVTQYPVDGQKIDHLDFPSTTHQWSTVESSTQNPEPPPNLSVREDGLAQKRKDLQAQLSSLNPIEENTKLEQISRVLDGSAAIVNIKKPKTNPKSHAKPKPQASSKKRKLEDLSPPSRNLSQLTGSYSQSITILNPQNHLSHPKEISSNPHCKSP